VLQHTTEPLRFTPHVSPNPALTEMKSRNGGMAPPSISLPQHSAEPSGLTPQVWKAPALTAANLPDGGEA
jgi:hypothetical protein